MNGCTNVYLPCDLYDAGCTVIATSESKVEELSTCWISPGNWRKDNDVFNEIRSEEKMRHKNETYNSNSRMQRSVQSGTFKLSSIAVVTYVLSFWSSRR